MTLAAAAAVAVVALGAGPLAAQGVDTPLSRREFELRTSELDRRLTQRFDLGDRALSVALTAMERRLDGMNEFRDALKDQQGLFVTRPEWAAAHQDLHNAIDELRAYKDNLQGRVQATILLVGAFFTLLNLGTIWFFHQREKNGGRKP